MFYLILFKDKISKNCTIHTCNDSNDVNQYLSERYNNIDYYNEDYNYRMYLYSNELIIVVNSNYPPKEDNFQNSPSNQYEKIISDYIIKIRDEKINKIRDEKINKIIE